MSEAKSSTVEHEKTATGHATGEHIGNEDAQTPVRIDVWSDYNCPWCRLGTASLEELQKGENVEIEWHAYELRPMGSPPMTAEYRAMIDKGRPRLEQIARETYGIALNNPHFVINSRPALVGAKFAEAQGLGAQYHERVMRAYWQEAQDISDIEVLGGLAEELGLPRAQYLSALNHADYIRQVDNDIESAAASGITGVPAMVFAGKYLVSGAQPPDVLRQVTAKVRELEAQAGTVPA